MTFTKRQTATLLAALRLFQQQHLYGRTYDLPPNLMPYFDEHEALDPNEIDELCERINFDGK